MNTGKLCITLIFFSLAFNSTYLFAGQTWHGVTFPDKNQLDRAKEEVKKIDANAVLTNRLLCGQASRMLESFALKEKFAADFSVQKAQVHIPKTDIYILGGKVIELYPYVGMSPGIIVYLESTLSKVRKEIELQHDIAFDQCDQKKNQICQKKMQKGKTIILGDGTLPKRSIKKAEYKDEKIVYLGCIGRFRR